MASAQRPVKRSRWALVRVSRKSWTRGCSGGRLVAAGGGAGEGGAADGEGGGDRGQYAVAAVAEGGRVGSLGAAPADAGIAGRPVSRRSPSAPVVVGAVCGPVVRGPVCVAFMIVIPSRASPRRSQTAKWRGWCGSWGGATRPGSGGLSRRGDGWSRKRRGLTGAR